MEEAERIDQDISNLIAVQPAVDATASAYASTLLSRGMELLKRLDSIQVYLPSSLSLLRSLVTALMLQHCEQVYETVVQKLLPQAERTFHTSPDSSQRDQIVNTIEQCAQGFSTLVRLEVSLSAVVDVSSHVDSLPNLLRDARESALERAGSYGDEHDSAFSAVSWSAIRGRYKILKEKGAETLPYDQSMAAVLSLLRALRMLQFRLLLAWLSIHLALLYSPGKLEPDSKALSSLECSDTEVYKVIAVLEHSLSPLDTPSPSTTTDPSSGAFPPNHPENAWNPSSSLHLKAQGLGSVQQAPDFLFPVIAAGSKGAWEIEAARTWIGRREAWFSDLETLLVLIWKGTATVAFSDWGKVSLPELENRPEAARSLFPVPNILEQAVLLRDVRRVLRFGSAFDHLHSSIALLEAALQGKVYQQGIQRGETVNFAALDAAKNSMLKHAEESLSAWKIFNNAAVEELRASSEPGDGYSMLPPFLRGLMQWVDGKLKVAATHKDNVVAVARAAKVAKKSTKQALVSMEEWEGHRWSMTRGTRAVSGVECSSLPRGVRGTSLDLLTLPGIGAFVSGDRVWSTPRVRGISHGQGDEHYYELQSILSAPIAKEVVTQEQQQAQIAYDKALTARTDALSSLQAARKQLEEVWSTASFVKVSASKPWHWELDESWVPRKFDQLITGLDTAAASVEASRKQCCTGVPTTAGCFWQPLTDALCMLQAARVCLQAIASACGTMAVAQHVTGDEFADEGKGKAPDATLTKQLTPWAFHKRMVTPKQSLTAVAALLKSAGSWALGGKSEEELLLPKGMDDADPLQALVEVFSMNNEASSSTKTAVSFAASPLFEATSVIVKACEDWERHCISVLHGIQWQNVHALQSISSQGAALPLLCPAMHYLGAHMECVLAAHKSSNTSIRDITSLPNSLNKAAFARYFESLQAQLSEDAVTVGRSLWEEKRRARGAGGLDGSVLSPSVAVAEAFGPQQLCWLRWRGLPPIPATAHAVLPLSALLSVLSLEDQSVAQGGLWAVVQLLDAKEHELCRQLPGLVAVRVTASVGTVRASDSVLDSIKQVAGQIGVDGPKILSSEEAALSVFAFLSPIPGEGLIHRVHSSTAGETPVKLATSIAPPTSFLTAEWLHLYSSAARIAEKQEPVQVQPQGSGELQGKDPGAAWLDLLTSTPPPLPTKALRARKITKSAASAVESKPQPTHSPSDATASSSNAATPVGSSSGVKPDSAANDKGKRHTNSTEEPSKRMRVDPNAPVINESSLSSPSTPTPTPSGKEKQFQVTPTELRRQAVHGFTTALQDAVAKVEEWGARLSPQELSKDSSLQRGRQSDMDEWCRVLAAAIEGSVALRCGMAGGKTSPPGRGNYINTIRDLRLALAADSSFYFRVETLSMFMVSVADIDC